MRVSRILTFAMLGMLLTGMASAGKVVCVVTWNVETIGHRLFDFIKYNLGGK